MDDDERQRIVEVHRLVDRLNAETEPPGLSIDEQITWWHRRSRAYERASRQLQNAAVWATPEQATAGARQAGRDEALAEWRTVTGPEVFREVLAAALTAGAITRPVAEAIAAAIDSAPHLTPAGIDTDAVRQIAATITDASASQPKENSA